MALTLISAAELAELRANPRCGLLRDTVIEIWRCGDEVCDCSQVQVVEKHWNPLFHGATWFVTLAKGTFCTDDYGDDCPAKEQWLKDVTAARELWPNAGGLVPIPDWLRNL